MPEMNVSPKWDPRPKEYKLNPEQMKRYLAGEKMEDILSEGNAPGEAPQQEEAPKKEGENEEVGKAKVIGMTKYRELEERYENLKLELDKQLKTTKPNKEYETLLQQKDAAIAELKRELKQTEVNSLRPVPTQELAEIQKLKEEMQHSQELFNETMAAKENAEKEVITLKNRVARLEDALDEKTTICEDLRERNREMLREVHPLRVLALIKLKRDTE